jgi:hypothetical protein
MKMLWIGAVVALALLLSPAAAINFYSPKYYVSICWHSVPVAGHACRKRCLGHWQLMP